MLNLSFLYIFVSVINLVEYFWFDNSTESSASLVDGKIFCKRSLEIIWHNCQARIWCQNSRQEYKQERTQCLMANSKATTWKYAAVPRAMQNKLPQYIPIHANIRFGSTIQRINIAHVFLFLWWVFGHSSSTADFHIW